MGSPDCKKVSPYLWRGLGLLVLGLARCRARFSCCSISGSVIGCTPVSEYLVALQFFLFSFGVVLPVVVFSFLYESFLLFLTLS